MVYTATGHCIINKYTIIKLTNHILNKYKSSLSVRLLKYLPLLAYIQVSLNTF